MPDLPTITVTATQADRLLAAFNGQTADDGTSLTAQQAYKRWLVEQLRAYVLRSEARTLDESHNVSKRAALEQVEAELPDPDGQ